MIHFDRLTHLDRYMVGKVKSGELEFGNPFSSSAYHLWSLKWTNQSAGSAGLTAELNILFSPEKDEYNKISTGYPHKEIIVYDIHIPTHYELVSVGVNDANIGRKFEKTYDKNKKFMFEKTRPVQEHGGLNIMLGIPRSADCRATNPGIYI